MKKMIESKSMFNTHRFEVVDKMPEDYFVWNIGDNMVDGYLPICQDLYPGNKDNYEINQRSLKAIAMEPEDLKILRNAAGYGVTSLKAARAALKRKAVSRMMKRTKELAAQALPIFEKIS